MKNVLRREEQAIYGLRALYRRYGYKQFKMSKFEEYDLYVRNKSFLVSDHMITFTDADGRLLALKPDVTLSIVKNTKDGGAGLEKLYYNENVYRASGDGSGIREIMQVGLECIGDVDEYAVSEVLYLAAESLAAIGDEYVLTLSDVRILLSVLDKTALSPEGRALALSYVKNKNTHGILALAEAEGVDGRALARLTELSGTPDAVLPALLSVTDGSAAAYELIALAKRLEEGHSGAIRIDFSAISDTKYYNGIVFKGFLAGVSAAVLSGGEYDNLMSRMGRSSKAIGFAVYLDLLERLSGGESEPDTDVLLVYGENTPPSAVLSLANRLTAEGERVLAVKSIPEKTTYRRIVRVEETV